MAEEVISWFSATRGFGWLAVDGLEENIFMHARDLGPEFGPHGARIARVGDRVEFQLEEQPGRVFRARFVKAV